MNSSTRMSCEQLIKNRDTARAVFPWDSSLIHLACGGVGISRNATVEEGMLLNCKNLLKEKVGAFSNFRGTARSPIATILAVSGNPEKILDDGILIYEMLKKEFWGSVYLPITAIMIAQLANQSQYENIVTRTREIYEAMKKKHPFLTSSEDSAYCALLALSTKTNEQLLEDAETCYGMLHSQFVSSNAVQSLCHVLALCDGDAEQKCAKTMELFDKLKTAGHKYGTNYELATLGLLAMSGGDLDEITKDMIEADEWLSEQKGFGVWSGVNRKQRLMYAGMLVQQKYMDKDTMQVAAVGGVVSMVIAQEAAMCAVLAASAATASNSSSSS